MNSATDISKVIALAKSENGSEQMKAAANAGERQLGETPSLADFRLAVFITYGDFKAK